MLENVDLGWLTPVAPEILSKFQFPSFYLLFCTMVADCKVQECGGDEALWSQKALWMEMGDRERSSVIMAPRCR